MPNQTNLLSKEKTQAQNRVWVRIASACNNKCIFCLDSDAQNGTFSDETEVKKQIYDGFKKWRENRVIISGWEASINPKFAEYVQYAKEIWYDRVQTVTNGNSFASEDFCKKVFDAGLEEVTFSFHGHNPILHDYLVATPGAFKKSLKWLIFIKKNYPNIIINIDVVVNKINVTFLPEIVKFFMKLWVYEFDLLQIIPFGRGFGENKDKLFYNIEENIKYLQETWKLSRIPGMYMWTNRFPAEAFIWYEDIIQDPWKIKWEIMWEAFSTFEKFVKSEWKIKPGCLWITCNFCFQNQYCHNFIKHIKTTKILNPEKYEIISGEEFPSHVYKKYGNDREDFIQYLKWVKKPLINIPKCLGWSGLYQTYNDIKEEKTLEDYTYKYIGNLYRKKALFCKDCIYNEKCDWIHINFIRSYGFNILQPIKTP